MATGIEEIRRRCGQLLAGPDYHRLLKRSGLATLALDFVGISEIRHGDGESLALFAPPVSPAQDVLAEACFQTMFLALPHAAESLTDAIVHGTGWTSGGWREWPAEAPPSPIRWAHAVLDPAQPADCPHITGDVVLYDEQDQAIATIRGLALARQSLTPPSAARAARGPEAPKQSGSDLRTRLALALPTERVGLLVDALAPLWANVLGRKPDGAPPAPTDNLFALGGDSLKAQQIVFLIVELGFEITIHDVFASPSIRELAESLAARVDPSS